jgi:hypothetical protein
MATLGKGTALFVGDGATYDDSTVWTEIGCAYDFSGSGLEVEVIEAEPCGDEEYAPKIPGPKSATDVTFTVRYTAANYALVSELAGVTRGYKLEINGGGVFTVTGFISAVGPDFPNRGVSVFSVTVSLSGAPTFGENS